MRKGKIFTQNTESSGKPENPKKENFTADCAEMAGVKARAGRVKADIESALEVPVPQGTEGEGKAS